MTFKDDLNMLVQGSDLVLRVEDHADGAMRIGLERLYVGTELHVWLSPEEAERLLCWLEERASGVRLK